MPIEEEVCQILHGMTLTQEEADTIARMAQIRVRKSKFEIGQKVRIKASGQEFTITAIAEKRWPEVRYTADEVSRWYPASSLELVEEPLAIGDEVEVIGPAGDEYITTPDDPKTFVITEIREPHDGFGRTYRTKNTGQPGYPASSLRKIPKPGTSWQITELQRLAEAEDKLADMEKQLADLKELTTYLEKREEKHRNSISSLLFDRAKHNDRLCLLEAWKKDHDLEKTSRFPKGFDAIIVNQDHICEPEPDLEVGNWVQVMRSWKDGEFPYDASMNHAGKMDNTIGKIGIITEPVLRESWRVKFSEDMSWNYPSGVLRLLTNEEISQRLNEGPA